MHNVIQFSEKKYAALSGSVNYKLLLKICDCSIQEAATSRIEIANMYVQLQATGMNDLGAGSFSSHPHT